MNIAGLYPFRSAQPVIKTANQLAEEADTKLVCKLKIDNAQRQFNEMLENISVTYEQAIIQMQNTLGEYELSTGTVLTLKINENWKKAQLIEFKRLQASNDSDGITKLYVKAKRTIVSCATQHLNQARSLNAKALSKKIRFKYSNQEEKQQIQLIIQKMIKNESLCFQKFKNSGLVVRAKKALKENQISSLNILERSQANLQAHNPFPVLKFGKKYAFDWSFSSKELFFSSSLHLVDVHYCLLVSLFQQIDSPSLPTSENKREFLEKVKKVFSSWSDSDLNFLTIKSLDITNLSDEDLDHNYILYSGILKNWRLERHEYVNNSPTTFATRRTPLGGLSAQAHLANDSRNLWRVEHSITDSATNENILFHHTYRHGSIIDSKLIKKDPIQALELAKKTAKKNVERVVSDEFQINQNFLRKEDGNNVYDLVAVSLQGGGLGSKKVLGMPIGWDTNDERMNVAQQKAYEALADQQLLVNGIHFKANVICFAFATNDSSACYQGNNTERYETNKKSFIKLLQLIPKKLPVKEGIDSGEARIKLTAKFLSLFEAQLRTKNTNANTELIALKNFICQNFKISLEQATRIIQLTQDLGSLLTDRFAYRQNCPNEAPAKLDLLFAEMNAISRENPTSTIGQLRQTTNCKSAKDRTSRADATTTAFLAARAQSHSIGPFSNYYTQKQFQENPTLCREFFQKKVADHEHLQLGIISFSNLYGAIGTKYAYQLSFMKYVHFVLKHTARTGAFWAAPKTNTLFSRYVKN